MIWDGVQITGAVHMQGTHTYSYVTLTIATRDTHVFPHFVSCIFVRISLPDFGSLVFALGFVDLHT